MALIDTPIPMPSIPRPHTEFLAQAMPALQSDQAVLGIAAGGSYISPGLDEHSDLDLVVVVNDPEFPTDRPRRIELAHKLGDLIACFTGEHVGEPRLLICLYAPLPLHVDLKFTTLEGFRSRVEDPVVLFDPTGQLAQAISEFPGVYPRPDLQWCEDRIWIWIHFAAAKLRRGEFLTAKQSADYILQRIIGPLVLARSGAQPNQLRRLEQIRPAELPQIQEVASASIPAQLKEALKTLADLYIELRSEKAPDVQVNHRAEDAARRFLERS